MGRCPGSTARRMTTAASPSIEALKMAVVLFNDFELLDVAAPGELLGAAPTVARLFYCAQASGPVQSNCLLGVGGTVGLSFMATHVLKEGGLIADATTGDVLRPNSIFVPGGKGMRTEVHNHFMLKWLQEAADASEVVFTVCTGSWLLGATGALD